ncbi:enoyl-CoA hydratase-related protein [Metabacillus arenae]|uniref:Enoyl-CoA hydratase/isomerase family protein n=1 Tax=Metabacillus arenae TaxID=2771434 RepID=A0A926NIL2_9BACI|nr:enoyl-CoA hydratase-related protein [Metabacillus arenae]MBD1380678.1 enoyl-CoA hydratase/isomerase family protein [Metabacillus arenae]
MDTILLDIKDQVATVTLNRPDELNCFNYNTIIELEECVENIRMNPNVVITIFTGAGEKAFSAGADLKERKLLTEEEVKRNLYKIGEVFSKIEQLPQPTIAAINGYAFGGGLELALCCDLRIIAEGTRIGLTETSLAIIPGAGGTQRLPRIIGESKALELILTARKLTSKQAFSYGLAHDIVSPAELMEKARELADEIKKNGPIALKQAKFAIKNGMNTDLQTGLQIERKAYEVTIPTKDRKEALQAFSEKRSPQFKGK